MNISKQFSLQERGKVYPYLSLSSISPQCLEAQRAKDTTDWALYSPKPIFYSSKTSTTAREI